MSTSSDALPFDETLPGDARPGAGGRCLAERWLLGEVIGRGGSGIVHRATDRLGGPDVAVKLLDPLWDDEHERIRRETAALRLLTFPGVVRLVDEGSDGGQLYLVMELVDGLPFPGRPTPASWATLADPTIALLEALQRVHDAGILHRDLKPANVLVGADGRARILDFGLARGRALGETMTRSGLVVGTPRYVAPEQVAGTGVDARTDLYAVGAMLFEALAGRPPHLADSVQALLHAKVFEDPPALAGFSPDAPAPVVHLVQRLLARQPAERPDSAAEVLGALAGASTSQRRHRLPRLGGSAPVDALVAAALAGRSAEVAGVNGSGRSRCLHEAAEALQARGREVLWLCPGERPFESLRALLGERALGGSDAASVLDAADRAVREALERGVVVVADDAERLDRWTAACVERCRPSGPVLSAHVAPRPGALRLEALSEEELRPLFAGPDRVLHRREDGARLLWERTRGHVGAVAAEVDEWVGSAAAAWEPEGLLVTHTALARIRHQPLRRAASDAAASARSLGPALAELMAWIGLASPHATVPLLAQLTGTPAWQLAVEVAELEAVGAIARDGQGGLVPRVGVPTASRWSIEARQSAHMKLARALPPGAERRFEHLAVAGSGAEIAAEVVARGQRLLDAGRLEEAMGLAQRGLAATRRSGAGAGELEVLRLLVRAAVATQTPAPLETAAWELRRSALSGEALSGLLALVEAWQLALAGDRPAALARALAVPPQPEEELEAWRHALGVRLAVDEDLQRADALIETLRPWAEGGSDEIRGRHASWEGLVRYKQSRFVEASRHHERASTLRRGTAARVASLANTALALVEAFELDRAREVGSELLAAARDARIGAHELYAEWVLRAVDYRLGLALTPDLELALAAARVGDAGLSGMVALSEAAIAWRSGQDALAHDLLARARADWSGPAWRWHRLLARCLEIELSGSIGLDDAHALHAEAQGLPYPRGRLQVLGALLRHTRGGAPAPWRDEAQALAAPIPEPHRALRLDVLSAAEALGAQTRTEWK
ncbi:MAG: protein kinase [Deltaproteobacteria bacterium]|nr:protein kinase [Deltaproteobacteria bacterium]